MRLVLAVLVALERPTAPTVATAAMAIKQRRGRLVLVVAVVLVGQMVLVVLPGAVLARGRAALAAAAQTADQMAIRSQIPMEAVLAARAV